MTWCNIEVENDLTFHAGEGSRSMDLKRLNENRLSQVRQRINSLYTELIPLEEIKERMQFLPTARKHFPELVSSTIGLRLTLVKNLDEFDREEFRSHCKEYEKLAKSLIIKTILKMKRIA